MSTALQTIPERKASALALMATRMNVEPAKLLSTLKSTVFKNATDDELLALVVVANEYGLNPLLKELYAFPAKGGGIVPVVSVDGWVKLANSHPQMDGLDFEWAYDSEGKLLACTAIFWRKDRTRPVKVTEYLTECRRNTEPWKMEHRMLRHKAMIQGARVAFGFSGVLDEEEGATLAVEIEPPKISVAATAAASAPTRERRTRTIEAEAAGAPVPVATDPTPTPAAERSLQDRLADLVIGEGCTFDHFTTTAKELSMLDGEDINATSFDELSSDLCKRCLAAHRGLKTALKVAKEGGAK